MKWTATRSESLLCDNHARDQVVYAELALDENGKFLAIRSRAYQALGAYWWAAATAPLFWSLMFIPSLYDVQTIDIKTNAVFTNTTPTSVYRGAGRPEAIYLIERLVDRAAQITGIDRVELRRRNLIKPEALPYHTPTHHTYDSGEFEKLMDQCLTLADWKGFGARQKDSARRGKLRGRAVTPYIELGGVFNERMEIRFDPGGMVSIVAGTHSHGQGHATAFAQLVAEWLGVPFEAINYIQGDTEKVMFGRGTFAARSSLVGGNALRNAANVVIARGKDMAGALMEAAPADIEFNAGTYTVIGTDKQMSMGDVARAFFAPAGPVLKLGLGLDGVGTYSGVPGGAPNYPNGCQVCEVEVDPETGVVRIDRFVAVDDLGMAINPMICEGQIHGGIAQGVGQALFENIVYDETSGQLMTGSFLDYGMPRAGDFPNFVSELVEVPAKTNPLGIKGIGEAGTIAAPPTVVNAVLDALRELGVEHLDMPLTPSRIWQVANAENGANGSHKKSLEVAHGAQRFRGKTRRDARARKARYSRASNSDTRQQALHCRGRAGWKFVVLRERSIEDRLLRSAHWGLSRIRAARRRQHAGRHRGRRRWQFLVHREGRQSYWPHQLIRRNRGIHTSDCRVRSGRHRARARRQYLVLRGRRRLHRTYYA